MSEDEYVDVIKDDEPYRYVDGGPVRVHPRIKFAEASRVGQFDMKLRTLNEERGSVYGHPLDDFTIALAIKRAVRGCTNEPIRHCLEMIGVKMARLVSGSPTHQDSIEDIAGYARCMAMIIDEQQVRRDRYGGVNKRREGDQEGQGAEGRSTTEL